jgi:S1-C subfamily serine protease
MTRIVLKHLSGSKSNQVNEFPLDQFSEVTIGRDPSSTISYDPMKDDLVGRYHARIGPDSSDASQYVITDLNSRNGTFVNKQRIIGTARISPGDVIQFGAGGPELQFDLEPRPANFIRPTREADSPASQAIPQTREAGAGSIPLTGSGRLALSANASGAINNSSMMAGSGDAPFGSRASIGKSTVERMIIQARTESRKYLIAGCGVMLAALAIVAWMMNRPTPVTGCSLTPENIAQNSRSVVWLEVSWKLIYTGTGGQVYHEFVTVETNGEKRRMPRYIRTGSRSYEPALTLTPNGNAPIGGSHGGSGFVITSDGFILTNRHVAAAWYAPYDLPAGVLTDDAGKILGLVQRGPSDWIPAQSIKNRRSLTDKLLEGRIDRLNVTFPENKLRIPAQLSRVSDEHDVAMVKINLPEAVPKLEMYDNYNSIKQGSPIVVIGYPLGESLAPIAVRVREKSGMGAEDQNAFVPEPTVTSGIVGRVIKSGSDASSYYSAFGDTYQHTAATNPGNSGGPVFDQCGRVIAIHNANVRMAQGASYAVPIKYGMDLMGTKPVRQ